MIHTVLKYSGKLASVIIIFVSACTGIPAQQATFESKLPFTEAEEVFLAGFSSIAHKYIDEVSVGTLAMEGLRGLYALDPAIVIIQNEDNLQLLYKRNVIDQFPAPQAGDADAWAFTVTKIMSQAQTVSVELANASPEKLYEAIFDSTMGTLDIFSRYAGKSEAEDNRAKRDGFGGIGISFRIVEGQAIVMKVIPNTPSEKAGIRVGDVLTSVQGKSLLKLDAKSIAGSLRGPVDTDITLMVLRDSFGALKFEMKRAHIVPSTVTAEVRKNILYLKISSFNQGTASSLLLKLRKELEIGKMDTFSKKTINGIVLDLRGNPGGLLKQSIKVADAFLVHGDIIDTHGRHPDSIQHYEAAGRDQALGLPMVVLIDGKSASAAEIVAAALQDRERAVVVGTASYGKGTVQTVIRLPNSGEVTLTWAKFIAPSGYALHGLGVLPVICTSEDNYRTADKLRRALNNYHETLHTLEGWRSTRYDDVEMRKKLRSQCPPKHQGGEGDLEIAETLIADGTLYFKALDITSSAVHASE